MQNISIPQAVESGSLALPYSTDVLQGFLDLPDLAQIAATILLSQSPSDHYFARYELTGSNTTYEEVVRVISKISGKEVKCTKVEKSELAKERGRKDEWLDETMKMMFEYYDERYVFSPFCVYFKEQAVTHSFYVEEFQVIRIPRDGSLGASPLCGKMWQSVR